MRGRSRRWPAAAGLAAVAVTVIAVLVMAGDSTTVQPGGDSSRVPSSDWRTKTRPTASSKPPVLVAPRPAAVAARALLDKNSEQPWGGRWNKETGLALEGFWGKTLKSYTGTPVQIAQEFLTEYRPLVTGFPPEKDPGDIGFRVERVLKDAKNDVVMLQRTYRGVPIYQGGLAVHIDPEKHVVAVWGKGYHIDSLDVTPVLDSAAAREALKAAIAPDSIKSLSYMHLLIIPGPEPWLVYESWCEIWTADRFAPYVIRLDPATGEILEVQRMVSDEKPVRQEDAPRGPFVPVVPQVTYPPSAADSALIREWKGRDSLLHRQDTTRPQGMSSPLRH